MDKIMTAIEPVLNIIEAILLLACAFIVASIFKKLTLRGLSKTKLKTQLYEEVASGKNEDPDAQEKAGDEETKDGKKTQESGSAAFIGALIYLIIFLLFIPAIFSLLGIHNASKPLQSMFDALWNHLPNILACIVILVVGFMLAKLVRQLLIPIFRRMQIDKIQEKAGVETTAQGKLSSTLAYIVYVLILIPIIITALRSLHIPAISNPAISMLNKIFDLIPSLIVAILIIVIGNVIARFCGQIVSRLIEASGMDEKVARFVGKGDVNYPLSKITGSIVYVIILIFFIVQSFNVLHMDTFNNIGNAVISYLPNALSAILIMAICYLAASAARKALSKIINKAVGKFVYFAIWVIGIFMTLNQLGIASSLVNTAFIAIAGAFAIATAIAFGIGGKDVAAGILRHLAEEDKDETEGEAEPSDTASAGPSISVKESPAISVKEESGNPDNQETAGAKAGEDSKDEDSEKTES